MSDLPNTVTIESLNELIAKSTVTYSNPIGTLTHCVITLPCGFTVTGESACVDPKKYDKAEGEKWALEKAKSSLWMLEGYLLSNDRYRAELAITDNSYIGRMRKEFADLDSNTTKLIAFLSKPIPSFVSDYQWSAMKKQCEFMMGYREVLNKRINNAMAD